MAIQNPLPGFRAGRGFSGGHQAVDIPAPGGTPVRAAGSGLVVAAGDDGLTPYNLDLSESGGGKLVTIRHRFTDEGLLGLGAHAAETQYAHLSAIHPSIRRGAVVPAGFVIGYVGTTGNSTGNHLHFGFRVGGVWRDFREYLPGGSRQGARLDAEGASVPAPVGASPAFSVLGERPLGYRNGAQQGSPGRPATDDRGTFYPDVICRPGWVGRTAGRPGQVMCFPIAQAGGAEGLAQVAESTTASALTALGDAFGDIARNTGLFLLFAVILILGLWALVKASG